MMWYDSVLQLQRSLETKSGPAMHVLLRDVTRLSPCDMLVGDSHGTVVLFCDGQILQHKGTLSGKINKVTALEVNETACMYSYYCTYLHTNAYIHGGGGVISK